MDLFVLASLREGFPRAAMEAAAMGLPIVATDIEVPPGRGRRCDRPARAAPRDGRRFAEAVAALAEDGDRRKRMGVAGRTKAEVEFDQRRVIETTLDVYAELLAGD